MIDKKIISADDVDIRTQDINENALQVIEGLQDAGFQAYLVGGCVRDLLLKTKPKDFDVSTDATPEQVKQIFRQNSRIIGRRFRIVHVRFGYEVIEVATFRADANDREQVSHQEMSEGDEGQLLRDNVYGTLEEDVVRRDFRANALYFDPIKGEIYDFMQGIEDIREKKLISIGDPQQRFVEDPVRMLRVIRFAAKLDFSMEPEALQMIEEQGRLLSNVSPARLFEEVLKLFHGGAAYETYLLLRKYGLFKYLFPFTDQLVADGVEGMPERALQNTDKRVKEGKPVIPAFLFACMMWDPVRADARVLMEGGNPEPHAWRVAMGDGLRDQNQYVAVPKRLAEIILDIWNIHFRLIKRNPRMIKTSLNNRRFRAAYDFLLLRVDLHEVEQEIGDWWGKAQEVDKLGIEDMITELDDLYRSQREFKQHHSHREPSFNQREPDGNSINYNSNNYNSNNYNSEYGQVSDQGQRQQYRQGQNSKPYARQYQKRSGYRKRFPDSQGYTQHGRPIRQQHGRRYPHSGGGAFRDDMPKDDYGNYNANYNDDSVKKVKVRRKRRISSTNQEEHGNSNSGNDENPIF